MHSGYVTQIVREAARNLEDISTSPRIDAEVLLMCVLGCSRTQLFVNAQATVKPEQFQQFSQLLHRRMQGEPIAYITGEQEFWSLPIRVTRDTLIPRPETEHLVETALSKIPENAAWKIADLGTGSGAIALAIASERKNCKVTAVDASSAALDVAAQNAQKLGIKNISFMQSCWLDEFVDKKFHLIVSNPPYICADDEHLLKGDVVFEPHAALVSGIDGLDDIRQIVSTAVKHLYSQGWLMLEHGWDQAEAVKGLLFENKYEYVSTIKDLAGISRIAIGCKN